MSKLRVATLGLAATMVLAWAVPAFAHQAKAASTITVTEGSPSIFSLVLSTKTVKHGTVTFKVNNKGTIGHDFAINGKKTPTIAAGKSATLVVTFKKAGSFAYSCTLPGHAAAGMKGVLKVT
jgi:uncharacterized cupredoxin-like copper-binding protein